MKGLIAIISACCAAACIAVLMGLGFVRFFSFQTSQQSMASLGPGDSRDPQSLGYAMNKIVESGEAARSNRLGQATSTSAMSTQPNAEGRPGLPGLDTPVDQYVTYLEAHPDEALPTIKADLARLPVDAAVTKSTLLQVASNLASNHPEQRPVVRDLALETMNQTNMPPGSDTPSDSEQDAHTIVESRFLISTAHQVVLGTSSDGESALDATLGGMTKHSDSFVRHVLVTQFLSRYPDQRQSVIDRAAAQGITLDESRF